MENWLQRQPRRPQLLSAKPDSVYGGVQMGVITYSFRDMPNAHTDATAMLKYVSDANASGIELMNDAAEAFAGSPAAAYAAQGRGRWWTRRWPWRTRRERRCPDDPGTTGGNAVCRGTK